MTMNLVAIAGVPVGADAPTPLPPGATLEYDRQTIWLSMGALGAGAILGFLIWRRR